MSINCIRALLEDAVLSHSDKTAVVFNEQSVSYAELFSKVNQVASYLTELDLPAHSRIGVYSNKGIEQVIAILAILSTDYILVPLTRLLQPEQVEYIINDCDIRCIVTDKLKLENIEEIDPETRDLVKDLDEDINRLLESGEEDVDGVVDRAKSIETRFAVDHPVAERFLREIVDALSGCMPWRVIEAEGRRLSSSGPPNLSSYQAFVRAGYDAKVHRDIEQAEAESGKFDIVVAWKMSRLTRSDAMDSMVELHPLRVAGCFIATTDRSEPYPWHEISGFLTMDSPRRQV